MQWALLFELNNEEHEWHAHVDLDERNASWLMAAPGMKALTAVSNDLRQAMSPNVVATRLATHRTLADWLIAGHKPYENVERGVIPDDAVMADSTIGIKFYYLSELTVVDRQGLTDPIVARMPSIYKSNRERNMAHDRYAQDEYIEKRGVNISIYAVEPTADRALNIAQYAVKVGPNLYMPFDSPDDPWALSRFSGHTLSHSGSFLKTHPTIPSANQVILSDGRLAIGERFIGDFESSMNGWRIEGDAVTNHSDFELYRGQQDIIGNIGPGFLTSYHPTERDIPTGIATSPEFVAEAGEYLAFRIGGGKRDVVGARLLIDGAEVAVWRGRNTEFFRSVIYPLTDLAGETLQLELFDNEPGGGWRRIILDHVTILR